MGFVPRFHFWQNRQEKVFGDILERKKALLDYKNKEKKNRKIGLFKKGFVNGFGQKMGYFPRFHCWQNREEKSLCLYSRKKKTPF